MTAPDADRMGAWRDEVAGVLCRADDCIECEGTGREVAAYDRDGNPTEFRTCWRGARSADALLPLLARIDREARAEAWDEGYEAGYNDCLFDTRGLSTDPDAAEFPHSNPYRTTSDATTEEAE